MYLFMNRYLLLQFNGEIGLEEKKVGGHQKSGTRTAQKQKKWNSGYATDQGIVIIIGVAEKQTKKSEGKNKEQMPHTNTLNKESGKNFR